MKVTPEELYDEWTSGESSGVSAHRAQYLREELMEYSGRYIPHRIPELESMLDRSGVRGQITKELKAAAEDDESDEDSDDAPPSDEDEATEESAESQNGGDTDEGEDG